MRATSIAAYHHLKNNNLLSPARWLVYDLLFHNGPCTAGELYQLDPKTIVKGSVCARLTELFKAGLVTDVGVRACALTGMNVTAWDVTDLDTPRPIKRAVKESNKRIIERLEEEKRSLEKKNRNLYEACADLQDEVTLLKSGRG